jgi:hypothetical protein
MIPFFCTLASFNGTPQRRAFNEEDDLPLAKSRLIAHQLQPLSLVYFGEVVQKVTVQTFSEQNHTENKLKKKSIYLCVKKIGTRNTP